MTRLSRRGLLKMVGGAAALGVLSPPGQPWAGLLDRLLPAKSAERLPITPNEQFYLTSYRSPPDVRVADWSLHVKGAVDRPFPLTYEQLLARPTVKEIVTLECVGNGLAADAISTAEWEGVRLRDLLQEAGLSSDAVDVVFHAADGYSDSLRVSRAMGEDVLVAVKMNGVPLPRAHGFPARIIVPGVYGMKHVQWLTAVEAVTSDYHGYYQRQGWSDEAGIKTSSHIDRPTRGESVQGPVVPVAGYAFAGARGIRLVELSADGGETWHPVDLQPPLSPFAWQFWSSQWKAPLPGRYSLTVRATDGAGRLQSSLEQEAFPDGATGLHDVTVKVE